MSSVLICEKRLGSLDGCGFEALERLSGTMGQTQTSADWMSNDLSGCLDLEL